MSYKFFRDAAARMSGFMTGGADGKSSAGQEIVGDLIPLVEEWMDARGLNPLPVEDIARFVAIAMQAQWLYEHEPQTLILSDQEIAMEGDVRKVRQNGFRAFRLEWQG